MPQLIDVVFNVPVDGPFTYSVPSDFHCEIGMRVKAPFRNKEKTGYIVDTPAAPPPHIKNLYAINSVVDSTPIFDAEILTLARWMSKIYFCSLGECLSAMIPTHRNVAKSVLEKEMDAHLDSDFTIVSPHIMETHAHAGIDTETDAPSHHHEENHGDKNIILNSNQESAIESLIHDTHQKNYLYGVTGSGKTEVFLRLTSWFLAKGKGVIYLTPEIALTEQLVQIITRRFTKKLAVLHSHLNATTRLLLWHQIMNGNIQFVVGARSAIFAPIRNLGLVIIDEEQDSSYKSAMTPRYHARHIALKRAALSHAKIVMGSATPSIESWHLMNKKILHRLELPNRPIGKIPPMHIVDMNNSTDIISPILQRAIMHTITQKRQIILFLNRRGFAHYLQCNSCNYTMECPHCSVSMVYYQHKKAMICHYCGYRVALPTECPECASLDLNFGALGVENIEQRLRQLFPQITIQRLDRDVAQRKGALQKILTQFQHGNIDLLLGTQMVTKGLDFPKVKLIGILQADVGLALPDFRAQERIFGIITQVAGRAGRHIPDGEVIVQTFHPNNEAIRCAIEGKINTFYRNELTTRRQLLFPPFCRLFRLVFRGHNEKQVINTAERFKTAFSFLEKTDGELLGPVECVIGMIAKNHRHHILLRAYSFNKVHHALRRTLSRCTIPAAVHLEIDIDPLNMV